MRLDFSSCFLHVTNGAHPPAAVLTPMLISTGKHWRGGMAYHQTT
jgi:hypothetical protein